jgi:hypothetical protein
MLLMALETVNIIIILTITDVAAILIVSNARPIKACHG